MLYFYITLLFDTETVIYIYACIYIVVNKVFDILHKKGFKIDKRQIELTGSLSSLGYHNVKINLFKEVTATLKVQLVK